MATSSTGNNSLRRFAVMCVCLGCGAAGWWLRSLTGTATPASLAQTPEAAIIAKSSNSSASRQDTSPAQSQAMPVESAAAMRARVNTVVEHMFNADLGDAVEMMEKIGALTHLSDAEVRIAWAELQQRDPQNNAGTSFASLYLWGRMQRMGEDVPVPDKWGAQDFQTAIEAEHARRDRTNILTRLKAGEPASETERRVVFSEMLRDDPLNAIKLWCQTTKPGEYQREARWLGEALTNPDTRSAIMAQLRAWQKDGDLGGAAAALAKDWMNRDPAAVEQWLKDPAQADVRDAVMSELIATRAVGNAENTWDWAKSLSGEERRQALDLVAPRLAIHDPDAGLKLLSELNDPEERQQALKGYAFGLAGDDFNRWQQWRATLSSSERDLANEAAFPYWVNKDVSKAVEWLGTRPAGEAKDLMITSLVFYFAEKDPQTSAQWIRTISDTNRRHEAVTAALSNVGPDDLNRVRTLLSAMEN